MAGERNYLRVPPDSTGKRVRMVHSAQIFYSALSPSNYAWEIGKEYSTTFSDNEIYTIHVHAFTALTSTTGLLEVHYEEFSRVTNLAPKVGATILDDATPLATIDSSVDVFINGSNIIGYDNPEYGLNIDRFGAATTTFSEGSPQLTGMGSLKVSDAQLLASYSFAKSILPGEFSNSREGGSDVDNVWDPATRGAKLTVGTTQNDRATQTSNLFHSYEEGASMLFIMAARSGDAGKQFVARNWGAFDATDGFFFQIKGSDDAPGGRASPTDPIGTGPGSALRIVHRFTFNGVTSNHEITQKEWNEDTLLGTGGVSNASGEKLDVTKINTYWIDYQFMGGGRTRWGVFYKGERVVVHSMYHHNGLTIGTQNSNPLSNPNRPVCWAIANYGTAGSGSEFYAYGASVFLEAVTDPLRAAQAAGKDWETKHFGSANLEPYWRHGQSRAGSNTSFPALLKLGGISSSTSSQYHGSTSPVQFLSNGDENHSIYQPLSIDVSTHDIKTGSPVPIEIRLFYGCVVRGLSFDSPNISSPTVQSDLAGDHMAHRREIGEYVVSGEGHLRFDLISDNFQYGTVRNLSDQSISRSLQPIANWFSGMDYYSTGNESVMIQVGADPVSGELKHYFADTQPVVIRETDGDQDVATVLGTTFTGKTVGGASYSSKDRIDNPNDWYYLSYVTRDRAWLYASQADIADDRLVRTLTVDDCSGMDLGQTLTITTGGHTASIMKIDVDTTSNVVAGTAAVNGVEYQIVTVGGTDYTGAAGAARNVPGEIFTATATAPIGGTGTIVRTTNDGVVSIVGRSSAQINYLGAFTTSGAGAGAVISNGTNPNMKPDYWTSFNALTFTDLGMGADVDITTGLALYANPDPRTSWTYMAKHLDNTTEDEDGDALAVDWGNVRINWAAYYRERTQ